MCQIFQINALVFLPLSGAMAQKPVLAASAPATPAVCPAIPKHQFPRLLCFNTYGVKFPMFAKTEVAGPQRNALCAELAKATQVEPQWNFNKYLIDRRGKVLAHYPSSVAPESSTLVSALEKALAQQQ